MNLLATLPDVVGGVEDRVGEDGFDRGIGESGLSFLRDARLTKRFGAVVSSSGITTMESSESYSSLLDS